MRNETRASLFCTIFDRKKKITTALAMWWAKVQFESRRRFDTGTPVACHSAAAAAGGAPWLPAFSLADDSPVSKRHIPRNLGFIAIRAMLLLVFLLVTTQIVVAPRADAYYLVGVINRNGETVVPCQYQSMRYLGHGLFFAEKINATNPERPSLDGIVIDEHCHSLPLTPPKDCTLSSVYVPCPSDGTPADHTLPANTILEIHSKDGFGLCSLQGKVLLEPKFVGIEGQNDGFFAILATNVFGPFNKALFLFDTKTTRRIPVPDNERILAYGTVPLFPFATRDSDPTHINQSLWGFLDGSGKVVIKPQFSQASVVSPDGVARVGSYMGWTYVDASGKLCPQSFRKAEDFSRGRALVGITTDSGVRMGVIDTTFKYVIRPEYDDIVRLPGSLYAVKQNGSCLYQLITEAGNLVRDLSADVIEVRELSNNLILCRTKSGFKALHLDGTFAFDLPQDTLSVGQMSDGYLICEVKNDLPYAKKFAVVDENGRTTCTVHGDGYRPTRFGMVSISRELTNEPSRCELRSTDGRMLEQSSLCGFYDVESRDLIIKGIQNRHFNPGAWRDHFSYSDVGYDRTLYFAYFLRDYNLIGMPRAPLEDLLGKPDAINPQNHFYSYCLISSLCGNASSGMEIELVNDVVSRWRMSRVCDIPPSQWITTNMIINPDRETFRNGQRSSQWLLAKSDHNK